MAIGGPASAAVLKSSGRSLASKNIWFYVGTQGEQPGQGIFAARLNSATGALTGLDLAAELVQPTWLVCDPDRPVLYSVMEKGKDGKSRGMV